MRRVCCCMPLLLQIGPQCHAFIAGVASVIPLQWFQLFDEREIQVLISGAEVAINVEDLMVNTHYSGIDLRTCVHPCVCVCVCHTQSRVAVSGTCMICHIVS